MSIEKVREHFTALGIADRIMEFEVSSATVELAAVAVGFAVLLQLRQFRKVRDLLLRELQPAGLPLGFCFVFHSGLFLSWFGFRETPMVCKLAPLPLRLMLRAKAFCQPSELNSELRVPCRGTPSVFSSGCQRSMPRRAWDGPPTRFP